MTFLAIVCLKQKVITHAHWEVQGTREVNEVSKTSPKAGGRLRQVLPGYLEDPAIERRKSAMNLVDEVQRAAEPEHFAKWQEA